MVICKLLIITCKLLCKVVSTGKGDNRQLQLWNFPWLFITKVMWIHLNPNKFLENWTMWEKCQLFLLIPPEKVITKILSQIQTSVNDLNGLSSWIQINLYDNLNLYWITFSSNTNFLTTAVPFQYKIFHYLLLYLKATYFNA